MNPQKHEMDDETFADLLAGPEGRSGEADDLRSALKSYRAETLQWAERRSATRPSLQAAARRGRVWTAVPQWSLAAVAVVSIAAGVAHVYDRTDAGGGDSAAVLPVAAIASPAAAAPTAADIAADNRLLSSIDQALSYGAVAVDSPGSRPGRTAKAAKTENLD